MKSLFFLLLLGFNAVLSTEKDFEIVKEVPLLLGVFNQSLDKGTNTVCQQDIREILSGITKKELWALKILDASGRPKPAFIFGSNNWLGSEIECKGVNEPLKIATSDDPKEYSNVIDALSPMEVNYRVFIGPIEGEDQISLPILNRPLLHIGLCVPKSCSNPFLMDTVQKYLDGHPTLEILKTKVQLDVVKEIKDHGDYSDYTLLTAMIYLGVTLLMSYQAHRLNLKKSNNPTIFQRIIACFSIKENYATLMNTETNPKTISSIHLLRAISCIWVIVVHIMFFQIWLSDSTTVTSIKMLQPHFRVLFKGIVSVDVFFIIGGFLATFNFLQRKQVRQEIRSNGFRNNCTIFFKHLLHRYLRLTPVAFVAMLCSRLAYLTYKDCIFRDFRESFGFNNANWQYNFLYIQNLLPHFEFAYVWTWSLACEMQFYIYSLLLLFIYAKSPKWGIVTFVVTTVSAVVSSFVIMHLCGASMKFLDAFRTVDYVYTKPWIRITSYQSGMMVGYFAHGTRRKPVFLTKNQSTILWITLAILFIGTTFLDPDQPKVLMQLIMSVGRILYGLGMVGGCILMCQWGYGKWFEWVSTRRSIWLISKVSYIIYTIHLAIGMIVYASDAHVVNISFVKTLIDTLAITIVSYYLSLMIAILFELPYIRLSDEFILGRRSPSIVNTPPPKTHDK
ncbi:hypothetical protein DMENIID0001_019700 [Sergentomyia squamirostris]